MVDSNKIGSLTRTWPTLPIKKDHSDNKGKRDDNNEDEDKDKKNEHNEKKDPGDTIIDEYV